MKYFQVGCGDDAPQFFSIRPLRAYLKEHPEIQSVDKWWWVGSDLIECEEVSRDQIFTKKAKQLKAGMTAQWAYEHGKFR